jgi:hypothetical protein
MMLHQQMYYFETAKCMPKKEDGDVVFMFSIAEEIWIGVPTRLTIDHSEMFKKRYSHWMQMPKSPSPTDVHAFLG